jgi:hypothetical protein
LQREHIGQFLRQVIADLRRSAIELRRMLRVVESRVVIMPVAVLMAVVVLVTMMFVLVSVIVFVFLLMPVRLSVLVRMCSVRVLMFMLGGVSVMFVVVFVTVSVFVLIFVFILHVLFRPQYYLLFFRHSFHNLPLLSVSLHHETRANRVKFSAPARQSYPKRVVSFKAF